MTTHPIEELIDPILADPGRRANVERHRQEAIREIIGYQLAEIRKARGLTQRQVADVLGVSQPTLSEREHQDAELALSTLLAYVHALGGDLALTARFPDGFEVTLDIDTIPAA